MDSLLRTSLLVLLISAPLQTSGCGEEEEPTPCSSDDDCTLPALCGEDGLCAAPAPVAEGKPCLHDDHCSSGLCRVLPGAKEAVCAVSCHGPGDCKDSQRCAPAATKPAAGQGGKEQLELLCRSAGSGDRFLREACSSDADCRSMLCEAGSCTQPCGSCPAPLGECVKEQKIERGGLSLKHDLCGWTKSIKFKELGTLKTTATGVDEISFTIPKGVTSFVFFADDKDDLNVAIVGLTAPDGTVLIDPVDEKKSLMEAWASVGTATVLVPGTDDPKGAVQAGAYKARLETYDANDLNKRKAGTIERAAVAWRQHPGRGGLIDLSIHLAPGTGVTKDKAADNAWLKASLAQLQTLYRRLLGVSIGEVRYGEMAAADNEIKTWDQVWKIRKTYSEAGPAGRTINLFIAQKMSMAGGAAGRVPGVPGLSGRPGAGVVLRKYSDTNTMGGLMAHELGHFMGLWHTSAPGPFYDHISDTVQCPSGTPSNNCPDKTNMMFFLAPVKDPIVLSTGQASVVRGSPWQYELAYPDVCGAGVIGVDVAGGFASGTTKGAKATLAGSCGGGANGERVHLYRLDKDATSVTITAVTKGFDAVVHVRHASCTDAKAEVGCVAAAANKAAKLTLDKPKAGAYFIVVDGKTGEGRYELTVSATYP